jgi:hypothetical protein
MERLLTIGLLWILLCPSVHAQLMSHSKAQRLRRYFPAVDDPHTQAILDDPRLVLYTEAEMPRAYQIWDGSFHGVHSPSYNISAGEAERAKGHGGGGNGNIEFPWQGAGGTHRCNNLFVSRFLKLPEREGKRLPIVWYRWRFQGDAATGYAWTYPSGTVFGELLAMRGPQGYYYTFELRTRTKLGTTWAPNVFRPFPTAESLAGRIKQLRPNWESQPNLLRMVRHLEEPSPALHVTRLANSHPRREFDQWMAIDELPPLGDDRLVEELLQGTTFRSAEGEVWRVGGKGYGTHAPTTKASWHVVPKNYDAGFIAIDQASCARCHRSVNRHVDHFDAGRDWYGRVRGSDRIFSFHPFDPGSISYSGYPQPIRLRSELLAAGLLEPYDARRHPPEVYTRSRAE